MKSAINHGLGVLLGFAALAFSVGVSAAEPVTIRAARGPAAEEQYWLMLARPDLTPNLGKKYKLEMTYMPNPESRFQAMEAGALDITSSNAYTALGAAASNMPVKIIASISRESSKGARTNYLVAADSNIKSVKDLKGRTIGMLGLRSVSHFWALEAVKNAGLDPEKDVSFASMPLPVQGAAVRSGKIDVGCLVPPFLDMEEKQGGLRTLFTSKDVVPFDEELIVLVARSEFLEKNGDAVRAFLADLKSVTTYYLANRKAARMDLIKAQIIRTSPEIYGDMPDWYRDPDLKVDVDLLKKSQEMIIAAGVNSKRADIDKVVDLRYLPK